MVKRLHSSLNEKKRCTENRYILGHTRYSLASPNTEFLVCPFVSLDLELFAYLFTMLLDITRDETINPDARNFKATSLGLDFHLSVNRATTPYLNLSLLSRCLHSL